MQDIHESYQLLLKIVKARIATENDEEKVNNENITEEKEEPKLKAQRKPPLSGKKKKK